MTCPNEISEDEIRKVFTILTFNFCNFFNLFALFFELNTFLFTHINVIEFNPVI